MYEDVFVTDTTKSQRAEKIRRDRDDKFKDGGSGRNRLAKDKDKRPNIRDLMNAWEGGE